MHEKCHKQSKRITKLKYEAFKDIISADELDIEGEKDVADLVIEYIRSRREIPKEKPVNPIQNQENDENKESEEKRRGRRKKRRRKKSGAPTKSGKPRTK